MVEIRQEPPKDSYFYSLPLLGPEKWKRERTASGVRRKQSIGESISRVNSLAQKYIGAARGKSWCLARATSPMAAGTNKRWIQREGLRLSRRFPRLNPGEKLDGWEFQSRCSQFQIKPALGRAVFLALISVKSVHHPVQGEA
jgi:hypothetical protein